MRLPFSAHRVGPRGRAAFALTALLGVGAGVTACGKQDIQVPKDSQYYRGAVLFRDHCAGCHTLDAVGATGSAYSTVGRLRQQGPNFNQRKEQPAQVLYAIQNGGFSGAIMPENLVTGSDAQAIAEFLSHYSGLKAQNAVSAPANPNF
jgi:mono/diheme cytochrome c family protein